MITLECQTSRFNLSETKDDFINDCCFGEDFSQWITAELSRNGADADAVCMEDYGWFNCFSCEGHHYGLSISGYSEEDPNDPNFGSWFLSLDKKRTFWERITGRNKESENEQIVQIIIDTLKDANFENVKLSGQKSHVGT